MSQTRCACAQTAVAWAHCWLDNDLGLLPVTEIRSDPTVQISCSCNRQNGYNDVGPNSLVVYGRLDAVQRVRREIIPH